MCGTKRTFTSIMDEDSSSQGPFTKRICLSTDKATHFGPLHLNSPPKFAPTRPLPSIAARIPPFHTHGSSHCGNHAHEHVFPTSSSKNNKSKRVGTLCSFCFGPYKQGDLHQLPCGHFTCLSCLEERVRQIPTFMAVNAQQIFGITTKMRGIIYYLEFGIMETDALADTVRQYWLDEFVALRQQVSVLTNLSCSYCLVHIQLSRFMTCMSPEMSKVMWLIEQWLEDREPENKQVCG